MTLSVVFISGGLLLLYLGAEGLIRGSVALALRLGLTPLVVGLTVVAFGTSSPELVVSLQATLSGSEAIAIGNVVGSNICNIALILGLSALIRPLKVHLQLLRMDVPLMIIASALLMLMLYDGGLGRPEGAFLSVCLIGYTAFNVWNAHRTQAPIRDVLADAVSPAGGPAWRHALFLSGGLVLLAGGAHLLVSGAVDLAQHLGLSDAVIGLTIVALGTSLPELATSVVAAAHGEGDIAVGNVVGSNVFNVLLILGLSALVHPLRAGGITMTDLGIMTAFALLMLPLMRTGFRLVRWEGALLLVLYLGYVAYLLP